jgi:hypothetical protein
MILKDLLLNKISRKVIVAFVANIDGHQLVEFLEPRRLWGDN